MSTIESFNVTCGACGRNSEQVRIMSFSTFSEPDLDSRPAEMLRSTMKYWLMKCPHCGYVARDIRRWPWITGKTLRRIFGDADEELSALAYTFYKRALYCEHKRDITGAIRAYLCAAWSCDDEEDEVHAKIMRVRCLELVQREMSRCRRVKWRRLIQLMADLLRRTGDIEALRRMDTHDKRLDYATRELLIYQKTLAENHDYTAHSREELDLEPFDDFFDKKKSTEPDPSEELEKNLFGAVNVGKMARAEALEALDRLRSPELNAPYHEYDDVLRQHWSLPVNDEYPFGVEKLAGMVNEEFLELLESFAVSSDSVREWVSMESRVAMAVLHQLYASPNIPDELKNYAGAQERLYVMRVDDPFSDDSGYVGLIEPR